MAEPGNDDAIAASGYEGFTLTGVAEHATAG